MVHTKVPPGRSRSLSPRHCSTRRLSLFSKSLRCHPALKNGDAHLKNFGVLYEHCGADAQISLAPAYDIVTTSVYIKADSMALLLGGSKAWPKYKMLMRFGRSACNLTEGRCNELLQQVAHGMDVAMAEMADYIKGNRRLCQVGEAMMEQWKSGIARSLVKS